MPLGQFKYARILVALIVGAGLWLALSQWWLTAGSQGASAGQIPALPDRSLLTIQKVPSGNVFVAGRQLASDDNSDQAAPEPQKVPAEQPLQLVSILQANQRRVAVFIGGETKLQLTQGERAEALGDIVTISDRQVTVRTPAGETRTYQLFAVPAPTQQPEADKNAGNDNNAANENSAVHANDSATAKHAAINRQTVTTNNQKEH